MYRRQVRSLLRRASTAFAVSAWLLLCAILLMQAFGVSIPQPAALLASSFWQKLTDMLSTPFAVGLGPNLVAAAIVFAVGISWEKLHRTVRFSRVRFFWGDGILDPSFCVSPGSLVLSRTNDEPPPRYVKTFPGGQQIQLKGPAGLVLAVQEVTAISHLVGSLSRYRTFPILIEIDQTGFNRLNRTIVALGTPYSNALSEFIVRQERNQFCRFGRDEKGAFIELVHQKNVLRYPPKEAGQDVAVILKIRNERFPKHYMFVCAGLGEWGTSGAAWFLANQWSALDDYGEEFAVGLTVDIGCDESAKVIADNNRNPAVKLWTRSTAPESVPPREADAG
jgi:hypothetical protein